MKLLMVSSLLLLLNSSPIPTKNDQETAEDSGADTLALEKRGIISAIKGWKTGFKSFHQGGNPSESLATDGQRISNALSEKPPVLPELEQNPQSFDEIYFSLDENLKIRDNILQAFRTHDPTKDHYDALHQFLHKQPSPFKDEWKKIIQDDIRFKQFDLDKLLAWKGSFYPSHENLDIAIEKADPDMINFFIARETMPSKNSLSLAIKSGNLDLFKVLASKVQPNIYAFDNGLDTVLTDAIMSDKHGFIEHLVKEMKIFPNRDHFQLALKDGKLKTIKYLVEDGGYTPTANDLTDARQYGTNQEIIKYLTNMKKISERLSVSFDEAMKIVRKENLAIDFAYRFYNPFMDKFQNFQKWKKMDGSDPAKDKLEQYMWKNPNLQNFLKWEHSLYPGRIDAIYQERIDLFEYWRLTEEFTPKTGELIRAIEARSPVMVEYFLEKGVQTSKVHLKWAIPQGNLETIQVLLNQKKYSVTKGDLEYARGYGKPEIIEYLEQQLNTKSN